MEVGRKKGFWIEYFMSENLFYVWNFVGPEKGRLVYCVCFEGRVGAFFGFFFCFFLLLRERGRVSLRELLAIAKEGWLVSLNLEKELSLWLGECWGIHQELQV